jgi:hypothetical protein
MFRTHPCRLGRPSATLMWPQYLFTDQQINRTSRRPEAIPLPSITTLFAGWISRFGVQAIMTSDRGAQFTSTFMGGPMQHASHQTFPHYRLPHSIKLGWWKGSTGDFLTLASRIILLSDATGLNQIKYLAVDTPESFEKELCSIL